MFFFECYVVVTFWVLRDLRLRKASQLGTLFDLSASILSNDKRCELSFTIEFGMVILNLRTLFETVSVSTNAKMLSNHKLRDILSDLSKRSGFDNIADEDEGDQQCDKYQDFHRTLSKRDRRNGLKFLVTQSFERLFESIFPGFDRYCELYCRIRCR